MESRRSTYRCNLKGACLQDWMAFKNRGEVRLQKKFQKLELKVEVKGR